MNDKLDLEFLIEALYWASEKLESSMTKENSNKENLDLLNQIEYCEKQQKILTTMLEQEK
jgi:hypothetical protein